MRSGGWDFWVRVERGFWGVSWVVEEVSVYGIFVVVEYDDGCSSCSSVS